MALSVKVIPNKREFREVQKILASVSPKQNANIWRHSLIRMADLVSNNAKIKQMATGGGPPTKDGPPLKRRTSTLAGSIAPDKSGIPRFITINHNVDYGDIHELGETVSVGSYQRTISEAFGRKISPVTFTVSSHTRKYPARPYLAPALLAVEPRFSGVMIRVINEEMAKA
jgi:hypothetical protein